MKRFTAILVTLLIITSALIADNLNAIAGDAPLIDNDVGSEAIETSVDTGDIVESKTEESVPEIAEEQSTTDIEQESETLTVEPEINTSDGIVNETSENTQDVLDALDVPEEIEQNTNEIKLIEQELSNTVDGYNITAKGKMPEGTTLSVTKVGNNSVEKKVSESLGEDVNFDAIASFDIKLMSGDTQYQPIDNNEVVTISIKGVDQNTNFDVYRLNDNNEVTNMNASNSGDQVEFETNHFTIYTVGQTTLENDDFFIVNTYLDDELVNTEGLSVESEQLTGNKNIANIDFSIFTAYSSTNETLPYFKYLSYGDGPKLLINEDESWLYELDDESSVYEDFDINKGDQINFYFSSKPWAGQWCGLDYYLSDENNDGIKETIIFYGTQNEPVLSDKHIKLTRASNISDWEVKYFDAPFYNNETITNIVVDGAKLTELQYMFSFAPNVESINFKNCSISDVTYFNNIFTNSKKLKEINTDDFTKESIGKLKPITMANMFSGCESLESVDFLDKINTLDVTDMQWLFYHCYKLDDPAIGGWDTSNVQNMLYIFNGDSGLTTLDVSNWDVGNVTNLNMAFYDCSSLTKLDTSNWVLNNVAELYYTFYNCSKLTTLGDTSNWGLSKVTNLHSTFENCKSLTALNASTWNLSNCTDMYYTFSQCHGLATLDVSNWNVNKVTNFDHTFYVCTHLTSIDVSNWDVSSAVNMMFMFSYCTGLTKLDTSNWNTGNVTTMQNMFSTCISLITVDVSNWDVSNVTDINSMFHGDSKITNLGSDNVSKWNTSKFTNINTAFSGCSSLKELDVTNWDTSKCQYILATFENCNTLQVLDVSKWDVHSVITAYGWQRMFSGCSNIEYLDLSNWDGSKITVTNNFITGMTSLKELKTPKSMAGTYQLPRKLTDVNTFEQFTSMPGNETKSRILKYGYKVVFKDGFDESIIKTEFVELPAQAVDKLNKLFPAEDKLPVHEGMEFTGWHYEQAKLANTSGSTDDVVVNALYGDVIVSSYTVKLPAKVELIETDKNYIGNITATVEGKTKSPSISIACADTINYSTDSNGDRIVTGVPDFKLKNNDTKDTVTVYSDKNPSRGWARWSYGNKAVSEYGSIYYEQHNDIPFSVQTESKNNLSGKYEGAVNFFFKEANW